MKKIISHKEVFFNCNIILKEAYYKCKKKNLVHYLSFQFLNLGESPKFARLVKANSESDHKQLHPNIELTSLSETHIGSDNSNGLANALDTGIIRNPLALFESFFSHDCILNTLLQLGKSENN